MASTKRTWYIRVAEGFSAVKWLCAHRDARTNDYPQGAPWARFVVLEQVTEDGRPLETHLTPAEARKLARHLNMRADFVEDMNRQHDDGWTADAAREEV